MTKQGDTLSGGGDKWLKDFVGKVSTQLNVRREIDTLATRIPREGIEIEYIKLKNDAARKRLDEVQHAIDDIIERRSGFQEKIKHLQEERQTAIEEYDQLKGKETRIAEILDDLPGMRKEIRRIENRIRMASQELATLQETNEGLLHKKEALEEKCNGFRAQITSLEEEMAVMRNTRDIIGGSRPDQVDADVFDSLQDDVAATVETYMEEMTTETDNIRREIARLDGEATSKSEGRPGLEAREREVRATLDQLEADMEPDPDRETLQAEIDGLKKQEKALTADADETRKAIADLNAEMGTLSKDGAVVKDHLEGIEKRISDMMPLKQEMLTFDDPDAEMVRLKSETEKLIMDADVCRSQSDIVAAINSEMEPTRRQLVASIETYSGKIAALIQEIDAVIT